MPYFLPVAQSGKVEDLYIDAMRVLKPRLAPALYRHLAHLRAPFCAYLRCGLSALFAVWECRVSRLPAAEAFSLCTAPFAGRRLCSCMCLIFYLRGIAPRMINKSKSKKEIYFDFLLLPALRDFSTVIMCSTLSTMPRIGRRFYLP
jgi:hypothetical protein